jgi:elongation factor Ts
MSTTPSAKALARSACWSALESTGDKAQLGRARPQVAMHIAATFAAGAGFAGSSTRRSWSRERRVLAEKAAAGKPAQRAREDRRIRLKTFFKEVCLVEQPSSTTAKTVAQAVKEAEKAAGAPVALKGFVRFALGEGIEKQEADFAAEVASMAG